LTTRSGWTTRPQALLHHLVRTRQVRVVATVRDDVAVPPTVQDLWKSGHLRRIDLEPLGAADSARLVEASLGAPVEAPVAAELHVRSGGLPLALCELVCEAVAQGVLAVRDGLARATGPLPPSRRLLDVVAGNLDRLASGPRAVLDAVAVADPLPLTMLRRLFAEADLRAADDLGLIRLSSSRLGEADPHIVTVGHPLYGEAALAALTALGRRAILERLIDHATGGRAMTLRVASWCIEIGRPVRTDDLLVAARLTHRALDPAQAATFARALWRQRPSAETGLLYAATLARQLKFESVLDVLEAVRAFELSERDLVGRAAMVNEALVRLARHDEAVAELVAIEPLVRSRAALAHLTAKRAFTASVAGRTREGLNLIVPLAHSGDPAEFREAVAVAPAMLAWTVGPTKVWRSSSGPSGSTRPRCATPRGTSRYHRSRWRSSVGLCQMYAGRLAEAAECAESGLRAAEEHGSDYLLAGWLNLLGRIELYRGRPATATHWLGRVIAEAPQTSGGAQRALALNALVEAHALLGQAGAAAGGPRPPAGESGQRAVVPGRAGGDRARPSRVRRGQPAQRRQALRDRLPAGGGEQRHRRADRRARGGAVRRPPARLGARPGTARDPGTDGGRGAGAPAGTRVR
jgi:hypothetical protein